MLGNGIFHVFATSASYLARIVIAGLWTDTIIICILNAYEWATILPQIYLLRYAYNYSTSTEGEHRNNILRTSRKLLDAIKSRTAVAGRPGPTATGIRPTARAASCVSRAPDRPRAARALVVTATGRVLRSSAARTPLPPSSLLYLCIYYRLLSVF